jgi:hypothetical protein
MTAEAPSVAGFGVPTKAKAVSWLAHVVTGKTLDLASEKPQ